MASPAGMQGSVPELCGGDADKKAAGGATVAITPNAFERFIINNSICACCSFFLFGLLFAIISIVLLQSGALVFDSSGVWDVRGNVVVDRRDAFNQANTDQGRQQLCESKGGGPPRPCALDGVNATFTERSRSLGSITVYYEATGDGGNMLSSENLKTVRAFEDKIMGLSVYADMCMLSCKKRFVAGVGGDVAQECVTDSTKCSAVESIANLAFLDANFHKTELAACYVDAPFCDQATAKAHCIESTTTCSATMASCGDGATPYGIPPCRANVQGAFSSAETNMDALCTQPPAVLTTNDAATRKAVALARTWKQERSNLLPTDFMCTADGKLGSSVYLKSSIKLGGPLEGFSTNKADEECTSEECIEKWGGKQSDGSYRQQGDVLGDWFVDDMWPDIEKATAEAQKDNGGNVKIYAFSRMAMGTVFLQIMQNDGTLAMGSLIFVFFWIWTATGSFFLAACGVFECFISLFQAMVTSAIFSKYLGFMCVMMIFVILGIGADDIFVFLDAYKQSSYEGPEISGCIETRFVWAYRRSRNAMFVTTATTCVCFLAAGFSQIPTVSMFGFFGAFVVAWDYFMVITFFASATMVYSKFFEGSEARVPGGHMCIDLKCCCLRCFLPATGDDGARKTGCGAYKRLLGCDGVLVLLGVIILIVAAVQPMNFVSLLGTVFICIAAILAQAVLNAPVDRGKARTLETWFATTFCDFIQKRAKPFLIFWSLVIVAMAVVVGTQLKVAEEAPSFLREDHPLMRFIAVGSEFGGSDGIGRFPVSFVMGIDGEDPFDRSGVDKQTPGGDPEVSIGEVRYSSAAKAAAATPAGQSAIMQFCMDLRNAPNHLVRYDVGCTTAFRASTNPTVRLPVLGNEITHCETGVYCIMDMVQDYLTAHCKRCTLLAPFTPATPCNPDPNFVACRNADGTPTVPTFPAADLHNVLRSADFAKYKDSVTLIRHGAAHGHDNAFYDMMTNFGHKDGNFFAFVGINTSANIGRSTHDEKEAYKNDYDALGDKLAVIPDAFATSEAFVWLQTEKALYVNTYQSFIIAIVFCWIVLVVTTWNFILGTVGFITVAAVCVVFLGMIIIFGWELGIIEAIALIIVVGLSVDYSIHLVHAYGEGSKTMYSREDKVRYALSSMGISLIGGSATTAGAALFLFFCNIMFFARFGQALCLTVVVSIFMALTFLAPLLSVMGPQGASGYFPACGPCSGGAQWREKIVDPTQASD